MRKTRKAAKIVWEADRKRAKDRLGADVSLCSAFWSRLFFFARSQRGFVADCGMALGWGQVWLDMEHLSQFQCTATRA